MTYLLHPAAMKLFFTAQDHQIAFRQAPDVPFLFTHSGNIACGLPYITKIPQQNSKTDVLHSGRPATEHFTNRVFGLPSHLFFPHHAALLQGLRAQLTPAHLPHHAHGLLLRLERCAEGVLSTPRKVSPLCFPDIR